MRSELAFFALVIQQGGTVRIKQSIMEDLLKETWKMDMHYDHISHEFIFEAKQVNLNTLSGLTPTSVIVDEHTGEGNEP